MMSRPRGFTLVELLVVIAVIAILAGLSFSGFMSARNQSLITATRAMTGRLIHALAAYKNDFGTYPMFYPESLSGYPTQVEFTRFENSAVDTNEDRLSRVLGVLAGTEGYVGSINTRTEYYHDPNQKVTYLDSVNIKAEMPEKNNINNGGGSRKVFTRINDPWGKPLIYVYLIGYSTTSNQITTLKYYTNGSGTLVEMPKGATLARLSSLALTYGERNGNSSWTPRYSDNTTTDVRTVAGRPTTTNGGAPAPWRNAAGQYPFATEFELWSSGPDGRINNGSSNSLYADLTYTSSPPPVGPDGEERMHNLKEAANRDNISATQWKME